jgi:hypothetical protein
VNDDLVFIDDVALEAVVDDVPMPVRLSHDFVDALSTRGVRARRSVVGAERS